MIDSASSREGTARWKTHRSLQEPVLETVEEEIGVASPEGPKPSAAHAGNGLDASGPISWTRVREQVLEQVGQQPVRTALLALGAGALSAWLLSQALNRRRGRN